MTVIAEVTGFLTVALFMLFGLALSILKSSTVDIQKYLEERERQKTIRKLAEIQQQRETVGVAEDRDLFEGEDIDIEKAITPTSTDTKTSADNEKDTDEMVTEYEQDE
mgnify:FL=1